MASASPTFPAPQLAHAQRLLHQGDAGTALQLLSQTLGQAGDDTTARAAVLGPLAELFAEITPRGYHPRLERDLLACFDAGDPQRLARTAAGLLLHKYPEPEIDAAASDPLWVALLARCINTHAAMEARLIAMRDLLVARGDTATPLLPALALQAFAGEYAWPPAPGEGLLALLSRPAPRDLELPHGALWDELARTRKDLAAECTLAAALPDLGDSANAVSAAVRDQYEASPYPRWRTPPVPPPRDVRAFLAALPGIAPAVLPAAPLQVLIAGAGTGFEAVDMARMDTTLAITALDLSRASLAYGKRAADALGVTNIRFLQGDILALDQLGQRFGFATSTGVLHHMARPGDGLASIADVLEPGGIVRLALYSRRARAPIRAAHALIAARGWRPDGEGIRAFREYVLALPASDPLAVLRDSDDFYSLSGCRDLAFHVHEHHFSLPEIGELVRDAGLRLVGLDVPPEAQALFRDSFGSAADRLDLALWDRIEARRPFLFADMIQLLAQKPGQARSGAR